MNATATCNGTVDNAVGNKEVRIDYDASNAPANNILAVAAGGTGSFSQALAPADKVVVSRAPVTPPNFSVSGSGVLTNPAGANGVYAVVYHSAANGDTELARAAPGDADASYSFTMNRQGDCISLDHVAP
jgi:hypothetical protein